MEKEGTKDRNKERSLMKERTSGRREMKETERNFNKKGINVT